MDVKERCQIQVLRDTMIRQEDMFKQQVRELHRLYQRQKVLMEKVKMKREAAQELGVTRDFLHALDLRPQNRGRVKRLRTLDLEQLPDDNDEEEEAVYVRQSVGQMIDRRDQHWDCEAPSPAAAAADSQTLSLFPIPTSAPSSSSAASAFTGPDCEKSRIRFCQPFNQGRVDQQHQHKNPWNQFGDDGARLLAIGQILSDYHQRKDYPAATKLSYGEKDKYMPPWQQQQEASYSLSFKASMTPSPYFSAFNGFYLETNRVNNTDSCKRSVWSRSDVNQIQKKPELAGERQDLHVNAQILDLETTSSDCFAAAVISDLDHPDRLKTKTHSIKPEQESQAAISASGVEKKTRYVTGSRATTPDGNTSAPTPDSSIGIDHDEALMDHDFSIFGSSNNNNKDTTTWAATILLSLDPDQNRSKSGDDATSSLLSWEVKLFKSVVIMLKQQNKASKKVSIIKSAGCNGKGAACVNQSSEAAAATVLETLKVGKGIDKAEAALAVARVDDAKGKAVGKSLTACNWLWGDVTRRKRMQRHRSSSQPQPVRCRN